jgi:hypothetical protein
MDSIDAFRTLDLVHMSGGCGGSKRMLFADLPTILRIVAAKSSFIDSCITVWTVEE